MTAGQPEAALAEAQQAVALAPNAVNPNVVLGDILAVLQRPQEARQSYTRALTLAQTIEPEFQVGWVEHLQKKLVEGRRGLRTLLDGHRDMLSVGVNGGIEDTNITLVRSGDGGHPAKYCGRLVQPEADREI